MLWHENAGTDEKSNMSTLTATLDWRFHAHHQSKDNTWVFSYIRRFVVIVAGRGRCLAPPINSYDDRGLPRNKFSLDEERAHTIVYGSKGKPIRIKGEPEYTKEPIAITLAGEEILPLPSGLYFEPP